MFACACTIALKKAISVPHMMRVQMHVLLKPSSAPAECVSFHTVPIGLLQLLTAPSHTCTSPSATALPLPQLLF